MSVDDGQLPTADAAVASNASAVGLAGLAATGAGVSTIAATAAGVCAGGACAVGAAGIGAPAAAAFGTFNAWVAGGLVAAATFFGVPLMDARVVDMGLPNSVEYSTGGIDYRIDASLAAMIRQATPPVDMKGKPVVIEFFRPACMNCNRIAPSIVDMEEEALRNGVSWVMINVDDPSARGLIRKLSVSQLPHFSFITAGGKPVAKAAGSGVSPADISVMVSLLREATPQSSRGEASDTRL